MNEDFSVMWWWQGFDEFIVFPVRKWQFRPLVYSYSHLAWLDFSDTESVPSLTLRGFPQSSVFYSATPPHN